MRSKTARKTAIPSVSFVSLGCPKALVDSERIITRLRAEGYALSRAHEGADLVIVNTCGFLDSAQAESLDAIGEALAENGKVIVTGCMGAEPEKITAKYPNVLAVTGPQQYESVLDAVHRAAPPQHDPFVDLVPPQGIKLTPRHYAYLKISEGCNNRCTFCIIPKLRGDLASRPAADVLREAERLVAAGVKELLVISQDTSAYGVDIKYAASRWKDREVRARFFDLARELGTLGAWVRLHYVYPYPHVDDVIPLMAEGAVLPYLDIPFQHASPDVLKRMKRPAAQEKTLARIARWRRDLPRADVALDLHRWLSGRDRRAISRCCSSGWTRPRSIASAASATSRSPAPWPTILPPPVPKDVIEERWHRFMAHQQAISKQRLKRKVGTRQQVIIDEAGPTVAKGRSKGDAPEIDGAVYVKSRRPPRSATSPRSRSSAPTNTICTAAPWAPDSHSMPLEVLHFALVLLGRASARKRPEVAPAPGAGIFLA